MLSNWYHNRWESQARFDQARRAKELDGARYPGREWRRGHGDQAAESQGLQKNNTLYPLRDQTPTRSNRVKVCTERRPGELYPHPGDNSEEWPGVSASHCELSKLPSFRSGGTPNCDGSMEYVWGQLSRRVDLDRVFRVMLDAPEAFEDVRPTGAGECLYKSTVWTDMNPYHVRGRALLLGRKIRLFARSSPAVRPQFARSSPADRPQFAISSPSVRQQFASSSPSVRPQPGRMSMYFKELN